MDYLMYINGNFTGESLTKIDVYNPANHTWLASVPKGGRIETSRRCS